MNRKRWFGIVIAFCFLWIMSAGMASAGTGQSLRPSPVKPKHTHITDHMRPDRVIVKFQEGSDVRLRGTDLVGSGLGTLQNILRTFSGLKIERLFSRSEQELSEDKAKGEKRTGKTLADLNLYFYLKMDTTVRGHDVESLIDSLNALNIVEIAYPEPIAEEARVDIKPTTPNFQGLQGYLNPAPQGVDALYAWTVPGGKGENTKCIDIEFGWRTSHEDLKDPFFMNIEWPTDHGTAVLGEIIGEQNGFGITGIAPQAAFGGSSVYYESVSSALNIAAGQLAAGDVIFIEVGAIGPDLGVNCGDCNPGQCQMLPMEYWQDNFDAMQTATANGIIVVEAAGNGTANLDHIGYGGAFDRRNRDSGAIMVGAGSSSGGVPMCWTNYGSRVDIRGWGENVVTTGYGDLFSGRNDPNQYYTQQFAGTSSATPIVVGSVLSIQGKIKQQGGAPLNAYQMRALLSYTGTPQAADPKHIGPLPDLKKALQLDTTDADHDGIFDVFETGTGVYIDLTNTGTSSSAADSDGDGLSDGDEIYVYHTDPNKADTDGDGVPDNVDNCPTMSNADQADSNGNGIGDACDCKAKQQYYLDADGDGYGVKTCSDSSCIAYLCQAAPHWVLDHTDCDDTRASVNPGASEICGDGLDNDCDGYIDQSRYYRDADGDGYGTTTYTLACVLPSGYARKSGDCNDANPNINPDASEGIYANGIDENCDGIADWVTQVIETSDDSADYPQIAVTPNGDAMAVWSQQEGETSTVWSNRYVAGSGWGTAQTIGSSLFNVPYVAMDSIGDAVAIWIKYDSYDRSDLSASEYTPQSGWLPSHLIETDDSGSVQAADLAMDASGTAIAVWIFTDNVTYKVMARRYVPGTGWETPQVLQSGSPGYWSDVQVTMDGNGNAAAVFRKDNKGYLWASRYVAGTGWTTPQQMNNYASNYNVRIAMDKNGNVMVVWQEYNGLTADIKAKRYVSGSGWQAAEIIGTSHTDIGYIEPDVAMNERGDAVVVWSTEDWKGLGMGEIWPGQDIWAKRYVVGAGWQTAEQIDLYAWQVQTPKVAMNAAGTAVAVWPTFGAGIRTSRYTPGVGWATAQNVKDDASSYGGHWYSAEVAMDASGSALAVWAGGAVPDIWAGRSLPAVPTEVCNDGIDNDGDWLIDCADPDCTGNPVCICIDNDGDGYGNPGSAACPKGAALDCNDNNASINPGATEGPKSSPTCSDGLDNDCDGKIDAKDPGCRK